MTAPTLNGNLIVQCCYLETTMVNQDIMVSKRKDESFLNPLTLAAAALANQVIHYYLTLN